MDQLRETYIISDNQLDYINRLFDRLDESYKTEASETSEALRIHLIGSFLKSKFDIPDIRMNYNQYLKVTDYLEKHVKLNKREKKFYSITDNDTTLYDLRNITGFDTDIIINRCILNENIPYNNVQILYYTDEFEYGIQKSKTGVNNEIYYIKFYNLLVIDYDEVDLKYVLQKLKPFKKDYLFKIYKTFKGFHVFVVSHSLNYNNQKSIELSYKIGSDKKYILYSKFNGYNVRLSPKIGYEEEKSHTFIRDYGHGKVSQKFIAIIEIFEKLNDDYKSTEINPKKDNYFSSFVKLNNNNINVPKKEDKVFIQHILNTNIPTFELVKLISSSYLNYIKKPQRCLIDEDEYYVAIDMNTNLLYICYRNIMMIDIDKRNEEDVLKLIEKGIEKYDDTYLLFKSTNGYHIFVVNRYFDHKDRTTIEYLIEFQCDINYVICTYIRSFCVRLNKKGKDDNLYKLIGCYERKDKKLNINKNILELINIQDFFIKNLFF